MKILFEKNTDWTELLPELPISGIMGDSGCGLEPVRDSLWDHLNPGSESPGFARESSDTFWDRLYLVNKAPTSQYDALRASSAPVSAFDGPLACFAAQGESFHGQRSRPWCALSGNIHLSLYIPLDMEAESGSLAWTALPAVAVMETINSLIKSNDANLGIKWVNDIVLGRKKLGGVISSLVTDQKHLKWGWMGIGLNVSQTPVWEQTTDHLQATCLKNHFSAESVPLGQVLYSLLKNAAQLVSIFKTGDSSFIMQKYQRYSVIRGQKVRIMSDPAVGAGEVIACGRVMQVHPDLSIEIENHPSLISDGRLFFED